MLWSRPIRNRKNPLLFLWRDFIIGCIERRGMAVSYTHLEVVSSEELFHHIWKDEYYSKNNNTITVHIRHLREKMQDSFEKPKYIKTVWGCGYKLES